MLVSAISELLVRSVYICERSAVFSLYDAPFEALGFISAVMVRMNCAIVKTNDE